MMIDHNHHHHQDHHQDQDRDHDQDHGDDPYLKAAAIIHMLLNNLDPAVAQFPQELVTYGGNGQVCSKNINFQMSRAVDMNMFQISG